MAELCQPAQIHWVDGSLEEYQGLCNELVRAGTFTRLNEEKWPGCFLARSSPTDVARVEDRTFICSLSKDNAGPTNNWEDPFVMRKKLRVLFEGSMRGRTMYVLPFSMGPIGSPMSQLGVQLTDSAYVVLNMRIMARITDQTEHVYGEARYAAGSWKQERRVIIKAEVVRAEGKEPKDNPRVVITNMRQSPQWLYEKVYCQRGEIENRIKELHAMEIDRTSCSRFWANQFRVLLTAAAFVLMQELRLSAADTNCARAQVWTLRERFLKLGARVVGSVRRLVVHLPQSFPFLATFRHIALELGASPG
jgi:hypothetical protein